MAVEKANVLITCAGRRVELVRAFKAARDALGLEGRVFCADCDPAAPALAFADGAFLMPSLHDASYIPALEDCVRRNDISLVIPTIDTELALLASARDNFTAKTGARIVVSPPKLIGLCRDKAATARLLSDNTIAVPETWTSRAEIREAAPQFPLIVKPADGSSSKDVFMARDWRELDFFMGYVLKPVVQRCLEGVEYTIDIFFDFDSRPVIAVPRRRIAVRGGEILRGRVEMPPQVLEAVQPLLALLSDLGAIGVITAQGFLCFDGVFRFTEINPRFGGGAPMSIAAGADFPKWLLMLATGTALPAAPAIRAGAAFSRFDQMVEVSPPKGRGEPTHG